MKLVFFGGVQGVGKSTLLSWLETQFSGKIVLLNPGELFRQYFYRERLKTIDEIEEMIVQEIERAPADAVVVVHWHYAVLRPEGFIPQISFSRLLRLAKSGKIEKVALLSVQASVRTIHDRRYKEHVSKERELSHDTIQKEIDADKALLDKHRDVFTRTLGSENVAELCVTNEDLGVAQVELYNFFATFIDPQESD